MGRSRRSRRTSDLMGMIRMPITRLSFLALRISPLLLLNPLQTQTPVILSRKLLVNMLDFMKQIRAGWHFLMYAFHNPIQLYASRVCRALAFLSTVKVL